MKEAIHCRPNPILIVVIIIKIIAMEIVCRRHQQHVIFNEIFVLFMTSFTFFGREKLQELSSSLQWGVEDLQIPFECSY